mmetsp:Transcript_55087/g.159976  ORF Transcript_55087/g.159976 Transcript_55087/m.159976 type:complete len:86 (+) Transcript_55087:104-361(+)
MLVHFITLWDTILYWNPIVALQHVFCPLRNLEIQQQVVDRGIFKNSSYRVGCVEIFGMFGGLAFRALIDGCLPTIDAKNSINVLC